MSNDPSGRRNFIRFSDARLHAESSTCMYSEHGLDALMRPEFGDVCHWLIVVSYCTPGSAQRHAASEISRISSRAQTGSPTGSPVVRAIRCQSSSFSTACMNSSVTRTELLAFWYWIDWKPSPSIDMSKPGVAQRGGLVLLVRLAPDEVADVRVVDVEHDHLRRAARLAAGLDRAGPGVGPAHEARPGPEAVPPLDSGSIEPRILERLMPEPEPPRKIRPSRVFQSRIESISSSTERMKQAEHCGCSSKPTLNQTGELNAASWLSRM